MFYGIFTIVGDIWCACFHRRHYGPAVVEDWCIPHTSPLVHIKLSIRTCGECGRRHGRRFRD